MSGSVQVFGRRPPQRVDRPASRRPKTCTTAEVARPFDHLVGTGEQCWWDRDTKAAVLRLIISFVLVDCWHRIKKGILTKISGALLAYKKTLKTNALLGD